MLKKIVKYIMLLFAMLLVLVAGVLLYSQTKSFRNFVRNKGLEAINPLLNGYIEIGSLDGNLFNSLQLSEVKLKQNDSVIFSIDSLSLKYHLASLFNKEVVIDSLLINNPAFHLWYIDSTTLNVNDVFNRQTSSDNENRFPLTIDARSVVIKKGQGVLQTAYGKTPVGFGAIELDASGFFKEKHVECSFKKMQLNVNNPNLEIRNSGFHFIKNGPQMKLDDFYLQSEFSQINLSATYLIRKGLNLELHGSPLHEKDLTVLLPKVPLRSIEDVKLSVKADSSETIATLFAENNRKTIGLRLKMDEIFQTKPNSRNKMAYKANINLQNFVPEEWLDINKTQTKINGLVNLQGLDLINYKDDLSLSARLNKSSFNRLVADTFNIDALQKNDEITAHILFVNDKTAVKGNIGIEDLYGIPIYHAEVDTRNLDVEAINEKAKNTVLNGELRIKGTYILSKERKLKIDANLNKSELYSVHVDSARFKAHLDAWGVKVDAFQILQQENFLSGYGNYSFQDQRFNAGGNLLGNNIEYYKPLGLPDVTFGQLESDWQVNGISTDLSYNARARMFDVSYEGFDADTICTSIEGEYKPDSLRLDGQIGLKNIQNTIQTFDTLGIDFSYQQKDLYTNVLLERKDSIRGQINANIRFSDTLSVRFDTLNLSTPEGDYYLQDTLQQIHFYENSIEVKHLQVLDQNNETFKLHANGYLSQDGSQEFELDVDNLDLGVLEAFMNNIDTLGGKVSTHIEVSGQHDSLLVNGNYTLNEPNYNGTPIPTIKGGVNYSNDSLFFHAWVPSLDSSVYANASLPLRLSLGDEQSGYFQMSDDFQANLNIDSLKITSPEMSSYQHMEAGAYLQGSLKASGKLAKPQIYGQLKIDSAYIYNQKQGVFYQQIDGVFTFMDSTVNIDTLLVLTDKGYLAGKGEMVFDSTIISGKLRSTNVETNINGFDLLQHNDYKVNISGNPYWKPDNDGHPSFGGKVSVNRSSFNLPSLIKTGTETGHKDNVPLLLQAIQEEDTTIQITREVKKKEVSPLLNQMRGRLTIDIPRATWLKGDDMNIEISGDFDIAKSGDYFELFGDVEVVRGYYILYGRKFNIEKGVITFTGGETPDPRLEITAEYTFRSSDKEKHILRLSVGGILSEPEIAFTLDDDAISESDAVSIMIFGKTMDELSYVGQNGIVGSVGSNMLANMITSSLNSTIGQRFKLDMIEVNSTENWQSAAFVVGKYITNDLFVIYQRGFGETEDDEITPETITLEYELSKLLFFRLQGGSSKTSGFDVILKIESSK